jgi:hypothetical protein
MLVRRKDACRMAECGRYLGFVWRNRGISSRGFLLPFTAVVVGALTVVVGVASVEPTAQWNPSLPTGSSAPPNERIDLAERIGVFVWDLSSSGHYTPPGARRDAVVKDVLAAMERLDTGAIDRLAAQGMAAGSGVDTETGRTFTLVEQDNRAGPGWGAFLVDQFEKPAEQRLIIEVPWPGGDNGSERLAVRLFRALPGSVLIMAGADQRTEDVTTNTDSIFHGVAAELAGRGLNQLQLRTHTSAHGARALEEGHRFDAVVASGADSTDRFTRRIADVLADDGELDVCRVWDINQNCGGLGVTSANTQAKAAAARSQNFTLLDLSEDLLEDDVSELAALLAGPAPLQGDSP